ncbi:hypothetical protein ACHAWU_008199 [Discostella pseudostelligera]|uniref:RanBP2-type domain-containing protein n=1 Tax=Discostella pseudostelligera TaxID=259834 RepID=A0ABD3MEJ5_9STRA
MDGHLNFSPNDNNSGSGSGSGGADDDNNGKSPAFHTPDQQQHHHQQQPHKYSASSSKKRSASDLHSESSESGGGSGDGDGGGGGWGITRLVLSFTPWRSRSSSSNKRSRTSLDDMSGSAIKRLVNQTDDDDDDDDSPVAEATHHVGGVGACGNKNKEDDLDEGKSSGYMSDGVKTSGTKLGKLNLEAKFDGSGGPTGGVDNAERRNVSFLGVPTPPQQQQGRGGGSSVLRGQQMQPSVQQQQHLLQQQQHQHQQSLVQGGSVAKAVTNPSELPAKKRVRILDGGDDSRGAAAAAMQSSPYHQFAASTSNNYTTIATFQVGSNGGQMQQRQQQYSKSPVQFRNVSGRRGTPAGKFASSSSSATSMSMQQRLGHSTAGSTPGLRKGGGTRSTSSAVAVGGIGERGSASSTGSTPGLRKGGGTRLPSSAVAAGGIGERGSASSTASAQRRSTTAPTLSSRRSAMATSGFNSHRSPLNARSYKPPMSRLLTAAYHSTEGGSTSSNGGAGNKSVMLTDSIVSQIVADNQNKLFEASSNGDVDSGRLFSGQKIVASTKRNIRGSEEDQTMITDGAVGTNSGMVVPRVRMSRILGSGQTGGRRFAVAEGGGQQSGYLPTSDAAENTTNEPPTKRSVTFQVPHAMTDTNMEDATHATTPPADANPTFVPYNAAILTPHATPSGLKLTPSKCELSMEEGLEIERLINSDEFKKMPRMLDTTTPPTSTSPKKKKKKRRQGTPHPSKKSVDALAMSTPALLHRADRVIAAAGSTSATTPGGAPFDFMSGGAAASSVVNTPMAYKFGDKKSTPSPSLPATSIDPPAATSSTTPSAGASTAPPTSTTKYSPSGWGDCFKSVPVGWNCDVCFSPNPKEQSVCLSCTAPKKSGSDGGTGSSTTTTSTPSTNAGAGAIGPGGFSFGGKSSSLAASSSLSGVATGPNPYTPNANSTSQPIPSFSGGLDLFKLKPGEWKCGACSCKNSASDSECGVCGTPRDNDVGIQKIDGGIAGDAAVNDKKASIGAGGFSFGGATLPSSGGGAISSGGFSFGAAAATSTATTPAKPKRSRVDTSDDDAHSRAPVVGFSFGAGAPSSATTTTKAAASSIGFSFGATSSGDEKKEDPVTATTASSGGGFSFGAGSVAEKHDTPASSTPAPKVAFSFGLTPQSKSLATGTNGNKDEASEPSSKKAMFSFGKGSDSGSTEERRVSFPSVTVAKEDPAPSTKPAFSFGNTSAPTKPTDVAPAILPAPDTNIGSKPSTTAAFSFGAKATDSTSAPAPLFSFGAPASTAEKKNDTPAISSQRSFPFGATPSVSSEPSTQNSAITPVAPFTFGSNASTVPSTGGASLSFGSGPPTTTSSTPAPSATSLPTSTAGSMFGAGSNPSAFGSMPSGFGSASQPAAPAPMPTTPGTTFSFGMGSTSTPATGGFGTTPNFGFGSVPPQPTAPTPTTGAFGMNANPMAPYPTPGFAGSQSFGANVMGGFTPQPTSGDGGGVGSFSIGSGARSTGQGAGRGAGRGTVRRIIKAKRPNM